MAWIREHTTKDGEKRYTAVVRRKGYPTQTATFRNLTKARAWIRSIEGAIDDGRHLPSSEARRRTFAELADRYISQVLPGLSPREQQKREMQLKWWKGRLGAFTLATITPAMIGEGRDALAAGDSPSGRRLTPASCNRYLAALSHAFTVAVKEWGWSEDNPVRRVRRHSEPRGRVRFLSDDERRRLLDACRQSPEPRLYPLVLLALATGARQAELLSLDWKDVDLARKVAIVHHTKNRERRALPLSGPAVEALRQLPRRLDSGLVFAGPDGRATYPREVFQRALEAAELEDFRFHDLRHTAASYLAMSGATLAEIGEILGHRTLEMVKRYSHLTEAHTARVVGRMAERFLEE